MPTQAELDAEWQKKQAVRSLPGATIADPSKNLRGPSNLVTGATNLTGPSNLVTGPATPRTDFASVLKPSTALAAALTPQGPKLSPSPWATLQPVNGTATGAFPAFGGAKADATQSLQQVASGGQNHAQAWTAGQRQPQATQSPFDISDYIRRPAQQQPEDDSVNLYGWGSAYANR